MKSNEIFIIFWRPAQVEPLSSLVWQRQSDLVFFCFLLDTCVKCLHGEIKIIQNPLYLTEMFTLQLGIARFALPTVRIVSRFVSSQPRQIWQKNSCISSALSLKLSPNTKCFSISSFHYQNTNEPFKQKPSLAKKKSERKRRTIIEDEQQISSNPVIHFSSKSVF